jgi:ketosteroid isomerase-like protein
MYKLLPVLVLLLAVPNFHAQDTAPAGADEVRILALENAWNQAVQQKDEAALKLLLGPDLVYVDYDGTIMDKAAYLASVRSQTLHAARIVSEAMKVSLYGAVAIVNGVYRENGLKNGKPYSLRERFTDTWVLQHQTWVCVASQSTLLVR